MARSCTGAWTWIVGLLPLAAANIAGILVLLIAIAGPARASLGTEHRSTRGAHRSRRGSAGRLLGVTAFLSGADLVRDSFDILS